MAKETISHRWPRSFSMATDESASRDWGASALSLPYISRSHHEMTLPPHRCQESSRVSFLCARGPMWRVGSLSLSRPLSRFPVSPAIHPFFSQRLRHGFLPVLQFTTSQPLAGLPRCDSGHGPLAIAAVPACPGSVSSNFERHAFGFFGSTSSHTSSATTAATRQSAAASALRR
jgi:hypothetical protein